MKGLVLRSAGKWYDVKAEDGRKVLCQIRGKLRLRGFSTTNPLAAGDLVEFQPESDGTGTIVAVSDRRNYIIRKSVNLSREAQIVAANLDQAILVVTLANPVTHTGFIDRFLVTAEAYGIPVLLVFHKSDQYEGESEDVLEGCMEVYRKIGYPCMRTSLVSGEGLGELAECLRDKVTLISGQSGTGKSSLVNHFIPGLDLRTQEVSGWSGKGQHTTTFAEMHPLPSGGYLVDTPGIKGFGLVDIPRDELGHYFREFFHLLPECRFANCSHTNEPGCAVIHALEEGAIAASRYESYLSMREDQEDRSVYR